MDSMLANPGNTSSPACKRRSSRPSWAPRPSARAALRAVRPSGIGGRGGLRNARAAGDYLAVIDVNRPLTIGLRSVLESHSVSSIMRFVSVTRAKEKVTMNGPVSATGSSIVN